MTPTAWRIEVLNSWEEAAGLRDEWNDLASAAAVDNPFIRHGWFTFWFPAFAPAKGIRILLLRQADGRLRAILPGYVETRRVGRLPLRCFCYAANGYSPYGGIIARLGDQEAIGRVVLAAITELLPTPHLLILPAVLADSDTAVVIKNDGLGKLGRRIEHTEAVPFFSMPSGWSDYLSGRSNNTRKRLKKCLSRSNKCGRLAFEEFTSAEGSVELIDRVRRLDDRTWQGQQGTGLFSTPENARFYNELLSFRYPDLALQVYLATIDGRDAAYSITMAAGNTLHGLKMGYDPDFADCSLGVLTMQHVGECAAAAGIKKVDLGAGLNEDKRHWETSRSQLDNWWLINRQSLRGRTLEVMLRLHEFRRKKGAGHAVFSAES